PGAAARGEHSMGDARPRGDPRLVQGPGLRTGAMRSAGDGVGCPGDGGACGTVAALVADGIRRDLGAQSGGAMAVESERPSIARGPFILSRRRPTFPRSCPRSIIGDAELNCRVRNGNGCDLRSMTTGNL